MAVPPAPDDRSAPRVIATADGAPSAAFRRFGWIPGRGFAFAAAFAVIAAAVIGVLSVPWSADVELLRVGGEAAVISTEAVKDLCPAPEAESPAPDAARRTAHVRIALWNRSPFDPEEPGEETVGLAARLSRPAVSILPRELSASRASEASHASNLRIRWVGVVAQTAMRDGMQSVAALCDTGVVRVVWNGFAPRAGVLLEAMVALPEGADAGDVAFVPVPLPAVPGGRRAAQARPPTFVPVETASVAMNVHREDVAVTRRFTIGALWLLSLVAAGGMAYRGACDALFGFRRAALAWTLAAALALAFAAWVLAPRVLLYFAFPVALLPG